jgi:peptide/nickel transport system substrate-binding protein
MKRVVYLTTVLVMLGMVTSCGPTPAPIEAPAAPPTAKVELTSPPSTSVPEEAQGPVTLVIAPEAYPPSFDPMGAGIDSVVDTPSLNLYNALVQVKAGSMDLEPELAESWEMAPDGLSYTFKLRKGVKFHDGSELTADDVKYTVDRVLALKKGIYQTISSVSGADVVDDYTVVLKLSEPFPPLLQALVRLYILNADVVKQHEEAGDWGEKWLAENEAGSGPYTLASAEREQQFVIEKFPDYFKGWDGPHVDRVVFRIISEDSARRLALEEGEVEWTLIWNPETFEALKSDPGLTLYSDTNLNVLYIALNNNNEYLKDPRIRHALALVYDYKGHVEKVRLGHSAIARGPVAPDIPCFDDSIPPMETNVGKAKELMAAAGYPNGGFELSFAHSATNSEENANFELMQAGAAELGITIKGMAMDWTPKVDLFASPETAPDMGNIWIFPNAPDPDQYLYVLAWSGNAGGGGVNFAYYSNPKFDELVVAARSELDPDKRCELYRQAQQIFMEDMPFIPIVTGVGLAASRDYVKGYKWSQSHAYTFRAYDISIQGKP